MNGIIQQNPAIERDFIDAPGSRGLFCGICIHSVNLLFTSEVRQYQKRRIQVLQL